MHINTREHQMIGDAVNNASFASFPLSQPRELPVRIVERICANMEYHADDVDAQISIVVKVSRDNTADSAEHCHSGRRHLELLEKLGQPQPDWPVKIQIENPLDFARFVGSCDA